MPGLAQFFLSAKNGISLGMRIKKKFVGKYVDFCHSIFMYRNRSVLAEFIRQCDEVMGSIHEKKDFVTTDEFGDNFKYYVTVTIDPLLLLM